MAQKSFIAQSGQSIVDLALIAYGNGQDIIKLANENPGLDINARSYAGRSINYTPSNNNISSKLKLSGFIPATASYTLEEEKFLLQEDGFNILLEDGSKIELE